MPAADGHFPEYLHLCLMQPKRYLRQLSRGANNAVIALSETEVGKLSTGDTHSDIGSEAEKMRFVNGVNDLVVKFKRLEANLEAGADMLVMERVYPLDFRAYEVARRELWLSVLVDELAGLHRAGFVHRDLRRPSCPASGSITSC